MTLDVSPLIECLTAISELLETDGEKHWRAWINRAKNLLEVGDLAGVDYLLKAYSGRGSFNDLFLGRNHAHGRSAWKPGAIQLNERLDHLRTQAWELATAIRSQVGLAR